MKKNLKIIFLAMVGGIAISSLTSCVPLAVGAAGGYFLSEGYKPQPPATRE